MIYNCVTKYFSEKKFGIRELSVFFKSGIPVMFINLLMFINMKMTLSFETDGTVEVLVQLIKVFFSIIPCK